MPTPFQHYDKIVAIDRGDKVFLRCREEVPSSYDKDFPLVAKSSLICADFGFEDGLYGEFEADGRVIKCQIDMKYFHLLEFVEKDKKAP